MEKHLVEGVVCAMFIVVFASACLVFADVFGSSDTAFAQARYTIWFFTDPNDMSHAKVVRVDSPSTQLRAALADSERAGAPRGCTPSAHAHFEDYRDAKGNCLYQVFDSAQKSYPLSSTASNPRISSASTFARASAACAETDAVEDNTIFVYRYYVEKPHSFNAGGNCTYCGYRKRASSSQGGAKSKFVDKTAQVGKAMYRLGTDGTAEYLRPTSKNVKTVSVPATISYSAAAYQVRRVAASAFAGCTQLKSVTLGANLRLVGSKAFSDCVRLSKLTSKTKKVTTGMLKAAGAL